MKRIIPLILLLAIQVSCTTSNVISTGPDTYMVTSSGAGFSTASVKENVFEKANKYCEERGLVMVPVSFSSEPGRMGRNAPSADLTFKALKPGDPRIEEMNLTEADQRYEVKQDISVSTTESSSKGNDTYTELLKLDELRKKGILSDEEFEAEKAKLLQKK
jgi:hypothetical protein